MKHFIFCAAMLCASIAGFAQSPEALKFAPRALALLGDGSDTENVLPVVITESGQMHLEFVKAAQVKDAFARGGQPIRFGDLLSALREATDTITRLQAERDQLKSENDKLWKIAVKDSPSQRPETIVVQQPPAPAPDPLSRYMLLRSFLPQSRPYQLPMPVNPNANRLKTDCTTQQIGTTAYTNCN